MALKETKTEAVVEKKHFSLLFHYARLMASWLTTERLSSGDWTLP